MTKRHTTDAGEPYSGETNGLVDPKAYHDEVTRKITRRVDWTDPELARVTRLRLLSDPGFPAWDVSYCHGVLKSGEPVEVVLPFDQLPKGRGKFLRAIVDHAIRDGVHAKRLGVFDAISTLI